MPEIIPSPTVSEEAERLRKWREIRRRAAEDPAHDRQQQAALTREQRLEQFEADKTRRIREAEARRKAEAEAIETRRMEKARAHLEALDDIETAKAHLLAARRKTRRLTLLAFGASVILPTLATALYFTLIAPPLYSPTSSLTRADAAPDPLRNPLFLDSRPMQASAMAPAFRMRAALYAASPAPRPFDISINTREGLITLTAMANTPEDARQRNAETIAALTGPVDLVSPPAQAQKIALAPRKTLLVFLSGLSLFALGAVFLKSILHHART